MVFKIPKNVYKLTISFPTSSRLRGIEIPTLGRHAARLDPLLPRARRVVLLLLWLRCGQVPASATAHRLIDLICARAAFGDLLCLGWLVKWVVGALVLDALVLAQDGLGVDRGLNGAGVGDAAGRVVGCRRGIGGGGLGRSNGVRVRGGCACRGRGGVVGAGGEGGGIVLVRVDAWVHLVGGFGAVRTFGGGRIIGQGGCGGVCSARVRAYIWFQTFRCAFAIILEIASSRVCWHAGFC